MVWHTASTLADHGSESSLSLVNLPLTKLEIHYAYSCLVLFPSCEGKAGF